MGHAAPVVDGIWMVRLPLPSRLGHVNAYVLEEADGWAVVDCGYATDEILGIWDRLLAGFFGGRPLRRLITTHGHTDHVGAATHLRRKADASYETTLIEWQAARIRYLERGCVDDDTYIRFARLHGCDPETARRFAASYQDAVRYLGEQPGSLLQIEDGDTVALGGRSWKAMIFSGHAEAHLVLHCEEAGLLLAGDQVLPGISPLIPVSAAEPFGNPLGAYLDSLASLGGLPRHTLVMPGHGMPFRDIGARCARIADHHQDRLSIFNNLLKTPLTSFQLCESVFGRDKIQSQGRLALSETIAHLNYLIRSGVVTRIDRGESCAHYAATPGIRTLS
ncbi:MAG: MBL fold metallo-hydrolase [Rhizobiaceae bacterium]